MNIEFDPIDELLNELRQVRIVIVTDDANRFVGGREELTKAVHYVLGSKGFRQDRRELRQFQTNSELQQSVKEQVLWVFRRTLFAEVFSR